METLTIAYAIFIKGANRRIIYGDGSWEQSNGKACGGKGTYGIDWTGAMRF